MSVSHWKPSSMSLSCGPLETLGCRVCWSGAVWSGWSDSRPSGQRPLFRLSLINIFLIIQLYYNVINLLIDPYFCKLPTEFQFTFSFPISSACKVVISNCPTFGFSTYLEMLLRQKFPVPNYLKWGSWFQGAQPGLLFRAAEGESAGREHGAGRASESHQLLPGLNHHLRLWAKN